MNLTRPIRIAAILLFVVAVTDTVVHADGRRVRRFRARGTGVFDPVNVGTFDGPGDADTVLGDGSGLTPYLEDTVGVGNLVGEHSHTGAIQTFGTGFFIEHAGIIVWPGVQGANAAAGGRAVHVLTAEDGSTIELEFEGLFSLDIETMVFRGDALFTPIGGTGRFANVRGGKIYCLAITSGTDELGRVLFDWDWRGFLTFRDDD